MANIRHPNITQFLGLSFLPEVETPLLVMERLEMSLDDLIECVPNLSCLLKLSFLEGVCCGLVHLHSMQPPVVHRDLTARNVLLTSSLVAKITDLGNSRIINTRPGQLARTLTRVPGTLVYMPPEALSESHRYGTSLDIFSFGHLALYCMTQVRMIRYRLVLPTFPSIEGYGNNNTLVLQTTSISTKLVKGHTSTEHKYTTWWQQCRTVFSDPLPPPFPPPNKLVKG